MSWIENIQNDLIIVTGDGNEYRPQWLNATKGVEYNVSEFDFPNVSGTLVQRRQPRGRKYAIEIYFRGEDNIDQAKDFEQSANDPRAWVITHPFYDRITVQPLSLAYDNTQYNITKITGEVMETITDDNPKSVVSPKDKIESDKEDLNDTFAESFETDVTPDTNDINDISDNTDIFYNEGTEIINNNTDAEDYFNLYNEATAAVLNATAKPLQAIRAVQAVINAPALFVQNVKDRIETFVEQVTQLSSNLTGIITPSAKKLYENNAGMAISAMALAAANPQEGDYPSRSKVLDVADEITAAYDTYLADLDTLQSDNGGDEDSYIPDADSLIALNDIINFTIANLIDIALNSRQERTVILEEDSNIILLAHRFYGLDAADERIQELIDTNNLGLNSYLGIRKGEAIIYYV